MARRSSPRSARMAAALVGIAVAGPLMSGCGSSRQPERQAAVVHLDGRVTGDYVRETSATGVGFLVPTGVLAAQGATSFNVSTPPATNSPTLAAGPKLTDHWQAGRWSRTWFIGPSITGTTPERARVELLVTGDPGRRFYLGLEESCGFVHVGPSRKSESALKGAHLQRVLQTPAVMILPTLTSEPENSCYVAGTVVTRGRNKLHISLIDY